MLDVGQAVPRIMDAPSWATRRRGPVAPRATMQPEVPPATTLDGCTYARLVSR